MLMVDFISNVYKGETMGTDRLPELKIKNIVIGSGAAGFAAAARLRQFGEEEVALFTENIMAGTSRNTGSDKQTYYKLSLAGNDDDSVRKLAEDLFAGQCVDGDIALCEAALSARGFYYLTELGVPFPCNDYQEFIGYKTDHDRGRRATSAGPYTSRIMTECLEKEVKNRNIPIYNGYQAIKILVSEKRVCGVLFLCSKGEHSEFVLVWCENIILATGGPAGMYRDSVYPCSQKGSSGIAFEAGVKGKNLTEWQFGMASLRPRWNVSGTYMQVLPRFVSTDQNGQDEKEFLKEYFKDTGKMLSMIFLKGYQWPFDTNKIFGGSSIIDLLIYRETILRGRRVFLDYRNNPGMQKVDYESLDSEAREYLEKAEACFGKPIDRLKHMNEPAIKFYQDRGVDLYQDMLEIAICAQHNNGGISTDADWQTDIKGLFAVGEVCGSHGVTRPGGTALNAGQVGAVRAADYIAHLAEEAKITDEMKADSITQAKTCIELCHQCCGTEKLSDIWKRASARMSQYAGMIRNESDLKKGLLDTEKELENLTLNAKKPVSGEFSLFYHLRDMLISQMVYQYAMIDYIRHGGQSRGSALYTDDTGTMPEGELPEIFTCKLDRGLHGNEVQEIILKNGHCSSKWREVRAIPESDNFFENQWRKYREKYRIQ